MATNKSRKRRKILIFAIIFLVIVGLSLVAIFRKREVIITVQTEKVGRRNLTELVVANGKIQPVVQVVICPEVSGEIIALPVKEGQRVEKGDLLVKIKPENYRAMRTSAEATYQSALASKTQSQASLTRADLDYKRAEKLSASQLISESQLLEAKTIWEVAKASLESCGHQVEQAKATLAKAEDDLSKTTIYAPMTGTITKLRSQVGERVVGTAMMAGTEILTVANLEEMEARVDIGEVDVILIALGQTARLEVDAFRDRKFSGTVTEIANSSKSSGSSSQPQQDSTKFEVKIRVQEKEIFRPGMSVTAEVETRSRTNVLAVPIQCVTTRRNNKPGEKGKKGSGSNSLARASATNSTRAAGIPAIGSTKTASTNAASSNSVAVASSKGNSNPSSTNLALSADSKKSGDTNKVPECVFVLDGEKVKLVPVKHGISDEAYMEITEGLEEGTEIITGGYKAINRDLEDGKKVKKGTPEKEAEKKD